MQHPDAEILGLEQSPQELLTAVHGRLRELHSVSLHIPDDVQVVTSMRQRLPDGIRKILDQKRRTLRTRLETHRRSTHPESQTVEQDIFPVLQAICSRDVRRVFAENLHESTLSTPEHPIHAKEYGRSLFNEHIRNMMRGKQNVAHFDRLGWVSFDANSVKAIIDCTSYDNATRYLQSVAQLFTNTRGTTRIWLEEDMDIAVTPMAVGGDEFAMLLRGKGALNLALLEQIVAAYQAEIASSEHLAGFLHCDDPIVAQKSGLPRDKLPKKFKPTFGGGGAVLSEGIVEAVQQGELSLENGSDTFDTARLAIFTHLKGIAERRQSVNKRGIKEGLRITDPEQYQLMLRTRESREKDDELRRKEEELKERDAEIARLHERLEALSRARRGKKGVS